MKNDNKINVAKKTESNVVVLNEKLQHNKTIKNTRVKKIEVAPAKLDAKGVFLKSKVFENKQSLSKETKLISGNGKTKQKKKFKFYYYTRKTLSVYKKHKKLLFSFVLITALMSLVSLLNPFVSAKIVENISVFNADNIIMYALIFFGVIVTTQLLSYVVRELSVKMENSITFDIFTNYASALTKIKVENYDKNNHGLFTARFGEIRRLSSLLTMFIRLVSSIISNGAFLFYLATLNIYLGLTLFAGLAIISVLEGFRIRKTMKFNKVQYKRFDGMFGRTNEIVRGIKDIKALNLSDSILDKTNDLRKDLNTTKEKFHRFSNAISTITYIFQELLLVILLIVGVLLVGVNAILPSVILLIYMYYNRALGVVSNFIWLKESLDDNEVVAERVYEIISHTKYAKESFGEKEIKKFKGQIEFKNVKFGYENKMLFNDLSFIIEPNKTTAIVGKSGQGKTTILSLISKFYDISGGDILFDKISISELSENAIRNNVSYITQEPYIFNFSIKENLLLAKPSASEEEIVKVCKQVELHDYIMTLNNGYDTLIGENGVKMSGGQKQRLSIARAVLKKSKVLLVDEATSALDNENQQKIKNTLSKLSKSHTIVIVAHRLSTIMDADTIMVMNNNKIIASGNHEELLKTCSIYKRLYKS